MKFENKDTVMSLLKRANEIEKKIELDEDEVEH